MEIYKGGITMKKIEIGNRKIYRMEDNNILLELDGNIYLLDENKWVDDTGKPFRNVSNIDKSILNELDPIGGKTKLTVLEG